MEKKYKWGAFISAPREYPVEVYTGAAGNVYFSQMDGFSNSGWGGLGRLDYINAPLPEKLDMTWLSYVDNKFYTGEWKLPTEKIKQIFDEGFYYKSGDIVEIKSYKSLNIGLGPKGMVVVWAMGSGHQIEIARFQAHETTIDPKLISENEKYMFEKDYAKDMLTYNGTISKDLREQIQKYGYPPIEAYEAYRERYLWKPKVILPEGCHITSIYVKMCDGEKEDPYDRPIDMKYRALPFTFEIEWSIDSGKKKQEFVSRIAFTNDTEYWAKYLKPDGEDELPVDFYNNEIRKLFKEHIDKDKYSEIIIKLDALKKHSKDWSVKMYLEQSNKVFNITQICQDSGKYE